MFDDINDDNDKEVGGGLSSFATQLHVERRVASSPVPIFPA